MLYIFDTQYVRHCNSITLIIPSVFYNLTLAGPQFNPAFIQAFSPLVAIVVAQKQEYSVCLNGVATLKNSLYFRRAKVNQALKQFSDMLK